MRGKDRGILFNDMKVGVLALQGSIVEHEKMLRELGVDYVLVRSREELEKVSHLIIPGGESTTLSLLMEQKGMWDVFVKRTSWIPNQVRDDNTKRELKVMGTCAGAILCARAGGNFEVDRNGYGAQQNSFVADLVSERFPGLEGVFIRAPRFKNVNCEVLASFDGEPVLLKDGNFLVMSFHPELCGERRVYEYFLR